MDSLTHTHAHTKFETSLVNLQNTIRLVSIARVLSFPTTKKKKNMYRSTSVLSPMRARSRSHQKNNKKILQINMRALSFPTKKKQTKKYLQITMRPVSYAYARALYRSQQTLSICCW
jgi:hypothetical protein